MTRRLQTLAMWTWLAALFGCNRHPDGARSGALHPPLSDRLDHAPEVAAESQEDLHDLTLYIQEHKKLQDGELSIRSTATRKGRPLDLEVRVGAEWKLAKNTPFVARTGVVTFHSMGPDSDAFLRAVDEVYETKLKPTSMSLETRFTAISLSGDPGDLSAGPVKIKMFFESGGPDDYAECYTNIDLAAHRLEICEKDESYRIPLVKALQVH